MSRRTLPHSGLFLLLSALVPLVIARSQDCERDELLIDDPALANFLQERLEAEAAHFPGTALAITLAGVGTWKGARGFSDLEQQIPMQPDDRVRIASITKTFVGAVVLQLDQEGVLSIEDAMERWVPGYFDGKGVTLRHLLNHTSGIVNYDVHFGRPDARTAEEIVAYVAQVPLLFTPGTQSSYSNTNFVILGMVIEAASGAPWHAEVRRRLLDPLGLADTYVAGFESLPGGRVRGYDRDASGNFYDVTETTDPRHCGAAGDMVSNTRDLLRWIEALLSGAVLDPRHLELMITNSLGIVGSQESPVLGVYQQAYGLALGIEVDPGTGPGFGHAGGMGGAEAFLLYYPDEGLGLAILANSLAYPDGYYAGDIAIAAAIAARDFCASSGCPVRDHDLNRIADACEIETGDVPDCNRNGIPDASDLASHGPRFAPAVVLGTGGTSTSFAAADLDGDAHVDFVASDDGLQSLSVLLNQGGGVYSPAIPYPLGFRTVAIKPADLDGDSDSDLVALVRTGGLGFRSRSIAFLFNAGGAVFGPAIQQDLEREVLALEVVDMEADGDMDLALAAALEDVVFTLANDGKGTFEPAVTLALGKVPGTILAADFNKDGHADLAVAHPSAGEVSISLGDGHGGFSGPALVPSSGSPFSLGAGDLDGDQDLDLVAGNVRSYSLSLFLNSGAGDLAPVASLAAGLHPPSSLALADFDADGDLDICTPADDRVLIRRNGGGGRFPPSMLTGAACGRSMGSVLTGDWDGDDRADLAGFSSSPGTISVLIHSTSLPAASDCNRNGIPDSCDIESALVEDSNRNGVPDDCEPHSFHRADPNSSGTTDISDGITIFGFLFLGNPATLSCPESADTNNDMTIDISDGISLLNWLFLGGPEPATPGPPDAPCGLDPDPPGSAGDLGCDLYAPCQ